MIYKIDFEKVNALQEIKKLSSNGERNMWGVETRAIEKY
jgi:hypothetical protein